MLKVSSEIKDSNFRSYFSRRVEEDMNNADALASSDLKQLKDRLDQLERIRTVQNLYFVDRKVMDHRN